MKKFLKSKKREIMLLMLLVVIGIFTTTISESFLTKRNLLSIINNNATMGIMAIGMMVIIVTGNIDISMGTQFGAVSLIVGAFVRQFGGEYWLLYILIGIVSGSLLSLINGFFTAKINIPAFIVTLGTTNVFRGSMLVITKTQWIPNLEGTFTKIAGYRFLSITVNAYAWLFVCIVTWLLFRYTKIGRAVVATGSNRVAAKRIGINVSNIYMFAFAYAGAITGLAGALFTSKMAMASPLTGLNYDMQLIAAAVLGGTAFSGGKVSVLGTFLGMLVIGTVANVLILARVSTYWQSFITGAILLFAVLFSMINVDIGSLMRFLKNRREVKLG